MFIKYISNEGSDQIRLDPTPGLSVCDIGTTSIRLKSFSTVVVRPAEKKANDKN